MSRRPWALGAALLASCSGITVPSDPAAQEGVIVERDRPTSFAHDRPTIWVKDHVEDECGVIYVIVEGTDLTRRTPLGGLDRATLADLQVGARVRVWTDVVLQSCPGQASAEAVEVLEAIRGG